MDRRLRSLVAAMATATGVVVALGLPAQASPSAGDAAQAPQAATAAPAVASPAILAAMQRDLNLTAEQARQRVAREYAAALTEAKLTKQLGAAFGGAWLNADASALIVGITDLAQADLVRASGAQPQLVARSQRSLDTLKARLDASAAGVSKSISGWYVDVRANDVVVLAKPAAAGAAHAFVARAGVDARVVRVVESTDSPRPLYDVRGGDAFYMGGGRCSIGFSVNGGFVTAGHCGSPGTPTSGYNQVAQGTFQGSSFPGNDYAWVAVNANWTPVGVVNNYSGGTVGVSGSTEAAVGASICRSGSTTGWHCGSIQAKNQTVN
ncbi:MAG TPA: S1 family peptidase, partial [Micromonosporaceae bacterium]|nr:S1 family peptidase [Micromonosporaceae bacterium]